MVHWRIGLCSLLVWGAFATSGSAQQLNPEQIQLIRETAASICTEIKEATGQMTTVQIQGDIQAKLGGLLGKVADLGGAAKGTLSQEEFEGISRDATAAAMQSDRDCRERIFNKMFDKLSFGPPAPTIPERLRAESGSPGWIAESNRGCWIWYQDPSADATVTWTGPCGPDGLAEGRGTLTIESVRAPISYNGEMRGGKKNGRGVLTDDSGTYQGTWGNDLLNGPGVYIPGGNSGRWEGVFHDGRLGRGVNIFPNGDRVLTDD